MGNKKVNLLPSFVSLSTQILPRCAWTRRLAIASPRPMPVVLRGRNAGAGVFHRHFDAVRTRQTEAAALLRRNSLGNATLPEMRGGAQRDTAAGRGVLQRVVQKIRGGLLYFLIVEAEIRDRRIEWGVERTAFAREP